MRPTRFDIELTPYKFHVWKIFTPPSCCTATLPLALGNAPADRVVKCSSPQDEADGRSSALSTPPDR